MAAMAIRVVAARATRSPAAFTRGFKIYTRTGDAGSSSLFNGERRSKDHEVFEALGDSDELNAAIGLARAHCETQSASGSSLHDIMTQLDTVQSRLLDVGSAVATSADTPPGASLQATRASLLRAVRTKGAGQPGTCAVCVSASGAPYRAYRAPRRHRVLTSAPYCRRWPRRARAPTRSNWRGCASVTTNPSPNPDPNPDPNPSPTRWATTLP